jgi:hypothetical protein
LSEEFRKKLNTSVSFETGNGTPQQARIEIEAKGAYRHTL